MTSQINPSRLSILGCALGGTAVQIFPAMVGATSASWAGPLGIVAAAIAGLGFNRVAAMLDKHKELRDAARDMFTNEDIAKAQATSIRQRLLDYADQLGGGATKDEEARLRAIAKAAPVWWIKIVSDPLREEVAALRDYEIAKAITPYLVGADHQKPLLDKTTWTRLLIEADQHAPGEPKLTEVMAGYFAGHICERFTSDFIKALKHDFQTDGKAYAGLSLRFFAEILSVCQKTGKAVEELKPLLDQVPRLLLQAQEAVAALRLAGLPSGLDVALAATERRLRNDLREVLAGIELLLDHAANQREENKAFRGELKGLRELLTQALARPLKEVFEFKAEISDLLQYAPAELIGRESEMKLLSDAWDKVVREEKGRPRILTFVGLGGEGKTSLVAKWVAELAAQDWPGCAAAFGWSFYRQGTGEKIAGSSDLFLNKALDFFGDLEMASSARDAVTKAKRLAQLVGQRRSLLILDGLEPLQYSPASTAFPPGQLKDDAIAKLLKDLAANSHGLCVVTTRYSIHELRGQSAAPQEKLERLSRSAGVDLLQKLGVKGNPRRTISLADGKEKVNEFEKLVEDVKGHALTLNLLGSYLLAAHAGDIRKVGLVKLEKADAEKQGGHAFRVMEAYERQFRHEGDTGKRALAILRLIGLFDRPASANCLASLWAGEAIPGLTEPLICISEDVRNTVLKRLEEARLLTVNHESSGALVSLDAHPLLREYFATRVKKGSIWLFHFRQVLHHISPRILPTTRTWRTGHRRLFEHLCATAPESTKSRFPQTLSPEQLHAMAKELQKNCRSKEEFVEKLAHKMCELTGESPDSPVSAPMLNDLQPLYHAVAHGCEAGLLNQALDIYNDRIHRRGDHYAANQLGAWASELGAIGCFFEQPWSRVSPAFRASVQCWLMGEAAFTLQALGRLTEALMPMRLALTSLVKQGNWIKAAELGANLSELELKMGIIHPTLVNGVHVAGAVLDAKQSVTYADRGGDAFTRQVNRCTLWNALHQLGDQSIAKTGFFEAERFQAKRQPAAQFLYSMAGFQYCDLLLAEAERASWSAERGAQRAEFIKVCNAVSDRAAQNLKESEADAKTGFSQIALDHLTLGRAALYRAILENADLRLLASDLSHIDLAVSGLRLAGTQPEIPLALLTRAWLRFLTDARIGHESAQEDLDEAWEIAERGPMKLFLADIHLHRARLFFREKEYPKAWISAQADLVAAEKLINECGYGRRKEELADAKRAILGSA